MPGFDTYGINEHDEFVVKDRQYGQLKAKKKK